MLQAVAFGVELTYDEQVYALGDALYLRHSIEILCSLLSHGCNTLALINVLYVRLNRYIQLFRSYDLVSIL